MRMVFLFLEGVTAKRQREGFGDYDQSYCQYRRAGPFHRLRKIIWQQRIFALVVHRCVNENQKNDPWLFTSFLSMERRR